MTLTFVLALFSLLAAADQDLVLVHDAQIYTMDPKQPTAEAFVHRAGEILAVGDHELLSARYPGARSEGLQGATVVPGFIDAHGHLMGLGLSLLRVDLVDTGSRAEIIQRLKDFEESLPGGAWLEGRGWDQNDWAESEFPTRQDLDRHFPDRPVWLTRIDGHAGWANSAAMAAADRDFSGDWQPEGGKILRDDRGEATGVFVDRGMDLIASAIPRPSPAVYAKAFDLATQKAASVGLTGVHDAGVSLDAYRLYQAKQQAAAPTLRIYAMADGNGEMLDMLCEDGPRSAPFLTARAVKLYADGALGSRGAALIEDYADDPGNRGLLIQPREQLRRLVDRGMGCGLQVNTHAIGDRANRIALEIYEQAMSAHPDNPGRHRIEHAQVIAVDDLDRFAELEVIASMQPTHATSDMYWAEKRVGPERIRGAYAWQTLRESGARLALGSDFPVERPDPLLGFHAAVTRRDLKGWPEGGWRPSERLNREAALAGFTRDAAFAAFQEDLTGSIEAGKRADFVVLAADIMTIPAAEIPEVEILATYVDGRLVYDRQRSAD